MVFVCDPTDLFCPERMRGEWDVSIWLHCRLPHNATRVYMPLDKSPYIRDETLVGYSVPLYSDTNCTKAQIGE